MVELASIDTTFHQKSQNGKADLGAFSSNLNISEWERKKYLWEDALPKNFTADVRVEKRRYGLESENFPKSLREFQQRQRSITFVERAISLLDLEVDISKAVWAELDLVTKLNTPRFLSKEEHLRGPATIVWGQGLGTFYGSNLYRKVAPWARNMLSHGTYNHPIKYMEEMGARVIVAKTDELINRGDVGKKADCFKTTIEKIEDRSDDPIYLLVHSVDAISAQVFLSKNRELASKLDGVFLVAGPLPNNYNPWVGDTFAMLSDQTKNFEYIEPVLDFYRSGDSEKVNIVSIKDSPDRVLDGWAGGALIPVKYDGHSSILHQHKNLRGIIYYINERSYPQKELAA